VAWSAMVPLCMSVADKLAEEGIDAEVVDPRTLRPLDDALIFESVRKTGRCVVVEIGWPMCGYGGEIAYRVQRECLDFLDAPIERVTSDDVPMPYALNLEKMVVPQATDVIAAAKKVLYLE
jgi:pyruvate dehydrogenase E1 component beta subunit